MIINPELKRYFWLDFSLHRLFLTALIIGLLCYVFQLLFSERQSAELAFDLTCFFIFLWGTKNASEAVTTEINNRTWDFQRQTALSPWSMTWGKLLGSTLFSWYGAFISFAVYAFLTLNALDRLNIPSNHLPLTQELALLILGGLFSQSLALLLSMQSIDQLSHEKNLKSFRYFVAGSLIGILMTHYSFRFLPLSQNTITWHGWEINHGVFAFTSLVLFLAWSLIGLQRVFSKALHYAQWPWVWGLFSAFCMIYFSGLTEIDLQSFPSMDTQGLSIFKYVMFHLPYLTAFSIAILLTYFALFTDSLDIVTYIKMQARYQEKNRYELLQQMPKWCISLLCVLIGAIAVIVTDQPQNDILKEISLSTLVLTSVLFLLRDILLFHYFHFTKPGQNVSTTIAVYLFMLYLLIPVLLQALHLSSWLPMLLPSWGGNTLLAVVAVLVQIAFIGALCWQRVKTLNAQRMSVLASSTNATIPKIDKPQL